MKKRPVLVAVSTLLLLTGVVVTAETTGAESVTKGRIKFEKSKDLVGEVIKPEVPNQIIEPETGSSNTGLLRIQHVPDFDFGLNALELGIQRFNAINEVFSNKNDVMPKERFAIPHFVQVTDNSGEDGRWGLSVKASNFIGEKTGMELGLTKIHLLGKKLSNDSLADSVVASRVTVFNGNGTTVINDTGVNLLEIKEDQTTNGTITSLVFDNEYDKTKHYDVAPLFATPEEESELGETYKNPGVVLVKHGNDVASIKENYVATLTWTLAEVK